MKMKIKRKLAVLGFLLLAASAWAQGPSPHAVTLTWDWTQGTAGVGNGFKVYRATAPTGPFTLVGTLPAITFRVFEDLESTANPLAEGATFTYEVTTLGIGGSESAPSNLTAATIPKRANAPSNLQSTPR